MKKSNETKISSYIETLLSEDIFNNRNIHSINGKLNKLLYTKIKESINNPRIKNIYQEIYNISDEIAILAETAIKSSTLEYITLSRHFTKKQEELKELYDSIKSDLKD